MIDCQELDIYSDALPEAKQRAYNLLLATVISKGQGIETYVVGSLPDGTPAFA